MFEVIGSGSTVISQMTVTYSITAFHQYSLGGTTVCC